MVDRQKITTFLWFNDNAEEAMNFYVSVFKDSKVLEIIRCGEAGPYPVGTVLCGTFQIEGQQFVALNGGPQFKLTEAVSLMVSCETQNEVDELWAKLTADGGEPSQCGWLKDKYGLSWQITPTILLQYIADSDRAKSDRVMRAMMTMAKIDINELKKAYQGA
jgi:predicted 3-demethylubiquinone-9 3-methyltransferase (glyoxalase superfamily)